MIAAPTRLSREQTVPRTTSAWLHGPLWDVVWLHGALWLAPLALWLVYAQPGPGANPLDLLYFALTALFWIGHRLSSVWLAYCTEAYRPLLRAQPLRFVALPVAVSAACFAWFLPPDDALPWTRAERLVALALVDYAFVTHHFAAQHFGALSLYRARAGGTQTAAARRRDRLFALGVGGLLVLLADALAGAVAYQTLWLADGAVGTWLVSAQQGLRGAAILALLVATGGMLAAELRAERVSVPRLLYVLGVAAMVAIALQPRSAFLFLVLWNAQHWLLATGLASRTPSAEPAPARGAVRRALHALNTRPWAMLLLLAGASILLLPLFEVEANREGGTYYGDRLYGAAAAALRESSWLPALVALGFATGFVHYALDRSLYRLSDPAVREAARGLLAPRGAA